MRTSIKKELLNSILDKINEGAISNENRDDWHFHCFNEDYFIIYHSVALEWLKTHDLDAFEAIEIVKDYEIDHFGEFNTKISPESIVNMIAYIYGEELIYSFESETVEELGEEIINLLN